MLTWECYSFNRGDAGFSSQICISISIRNNHFIHTSQPYNTNQKQSSTRPRLDGKAKTAKLVRKTEHKLFLFPDIKFHTDIFVSVPKADTIFMKWICHNWSDEHCLMFLKNCYTLCYEICFRYFEHYV
ncbi:uncharacterized protein LOC106769995 isoform X3 [Vigna radiata var. radiata]|uniref:Uncharacterized protein LOC106769995 isoform X3 n=1 Tax=Vigna radiata var. radiata TaxID=3916 RepID=A0A3Q0FF33_VIGRR|nr:uncharacterized protein LOC106769995 isoform X3 [Vigna radiata var. radiata]